MESLINILVAVLGKIEKVEDLERLIDKAIQLATLVKTIKGL